MPMVRQVAKQELVWVQSGTCPCNSWNEVLCRHSRIEEAEAREAAIPERAAKLQMQPRAGMVNPGSNTH